MAKYLTGWITAGFISSLVHDYKYQKQETMSYAYIPRELHPDNRFSGLILSFIAGPLLLPKNLIMTRYDHTGLPSWLDRDNFECKLYRFKQSHGLVSRPLALNRPDFPEQ